MALPGTADTIRLATYHTELSRAGPGLLLRDILRGEDEQIAAVIAVIAANAPDIVLLQGIDHDLEGHALAAFSDRLQAAGAIYPYRLALPPNAGVSTAHDLDGDGRRGMPRDAQSYGRFRGEGGMALLSRYPIGAVRDHSGFLWRDLPGGQVQGVLSPEALAVQRLASGAAWDVAVDVGDAVLRLLTIHAAPPVFDGPEDRNGRRNEDELWFWLRQFAGWSPDGAPPPEPPLAIIGVLNADPVDGEARRGALTAALTHPLLQDPRPQSPGGAEDGDATDTVDWRDPDPGNLRTDYILPSADLDVTGAGVVWPARDDPDRALLGGSDGIGASRHRLVWVDLVLEGAGQR